MPIRKENPTTTEQAKLVRNFDIQTLHNLSTTVEATKGNHLIVTGSYAFEAITGESFYHGDIDANIFSTDAGRSYEETVALLRQEEHKGGVLFDLYEQTGTYLKYKAVSPNNGIPPRRLEFSFVEIEGIRNEGATLNFQLKSDRGGIFEVPTEMAVINNGYGIEYPFRVKTLPYAVATWAIRVSGLAENTKRELEERDFDTLRQLLAGDYEIDSVLSAIDKHPQKPENYLGKHIIEKAMEKFAT